MLLLLFVVSAFSSAASQSLCYPATEDCSDQDKRKWTYRGSKNAITPDRWAEKYPDCKGKKQSPIELPGYEDVESDSSPEGNIQTFGYAAKIKGTLKNNGHTVLVTPNDGVSRGFKSGRETYNLQQFHFHYGCYGQSGNEHVINDDNDAAMEMHLVHKSEAGAIAVIGIVFQKADDDNKNMASIVKKLGKVKWSGDKTDVDEISLKSLIPKCVKSDSNPAFYKYNGSLTTPPCTEGVKWFVMNSFNGISRDQLIEFESVYNSVKGKGRCGMNGNVRFFEELNDRVVTEYTKCPIVK